MGMSDNLEAPYDPIIYSQSLEEAMMLEGSYEENRNRQNYAIKPYIKVGAMCVNNERPNWMPRIESDGSGGVNVYKEF